jgi:hypothetical protein
MFHPTIGKLVATGRYTVSVDHSERCVATISQAGQRDSSTGPIQPELNDQAELRQGYLLV